ncbi:MAG: M20/M25/M40 family metallo-hydrolase [Clostridia bacterium]|nr:M20/M25/M40 family metallo-hydrolase [Clostridia bacterium]
MNILDKLSKFQQSSINELHALLKSLVEIPAPSHHEKNRAEFIKSWLENLGAKGVYIDDAYNCVYPINCDGNDDIVAFCAHTDTVFPDLTPFELKSDNEYFYAPGVCDDTSSLSILLMVTKFIIENNIKPKRGILIVANAGEEGLGNLKGVRQLFKDYEGRISEFYTFDGRINEIATRCVGSHRYEIECKTEGGHSFMAFGNNNSIYELSRLICDLYSIEVPKKEGAKTTYNVGIIVGGTSVNTIAQSAKMLYEYRSDDFECLSIMQKAFEDKIASANARGKAKFTVKTVGLRPCGIDVDNKVHDKMIERVKISAYKHCGIVPQIKTSSTDCNIPLSLGIPAVCVGIYDGFGEHTREEKLLISSMEKGLKICSDVVLDYFEI